jgi:hypothetical protein
VVGRTGYGFVLVQYYGFTDDELDFTTNYDIKYRMSAEMEMEDD